MGEAIPMDGLSKGAKPKETRNGGGNVLKNVGNPAGGVSRGGPSPGKSGEPPPGSVSRNTGPAGGAGGKPTGDYANKGGNLPQGASEKHQKALQRTLGQLRKAAPELKKMASRGVIGQIASIKNVLKQIEWSTDWVFGFMLFPFALLKDLMDIALAAIPGVGIVVSFITMVMVLLLTVVALLIAGSSLKNRGLSKYIVTLSLGSVAEALPGVGWLPLAFIEALVVYGLVLFDRVMMHNAQKSEGKKSGGEQ